MKQFFTAFIMLAIFTAAQSQNFIACGDQSGEWNYDTVFVQCDIQIPDGQTLIINPGTKVIFAGYYSLTVQGTLKALGLPSDSILFTVADTTGFGDINSNTGGWNGIRLEDTPVSNDSTQFEYCQLSYGKAVGDSLNCFGGAIRIKRFNKVSMRHIRLQHNYSYYWGGALYAFKSNLIIENSLISDNYAGNDGMIYGYGGGLCFVSSDPIVQRNTFYRNSSTGVGGAASFEYSKPIVLDCIIRDNYSALGGGLCFIRSQPDRPIANLLIISNEAKFFGGGIANLTATTVMTNATITNNLAPMGGGYYYNEYAHAKLFNSILWGNIAYDTLGSQVWIWDVNSVPGFYNSIVQGGVPWFGGSTFQGEFVNCPDLDPMFNNTTLSDYSLLPGSPAINTALNDIGFFELPINDLSGHNRIMYGTADMGVYEYQGFVEQKEKEPIQLIVNLWPVPVNENSVITVESEWEEPCVLRVCDAMGKTVSQINIQLVKGQNKFLLNQITQVNQLSKGVYMLEISTKTFKHSLNFIN